MPNKFRRLIRIAIALASAALAPALAQANASDLALPDNLMLSRPAGIDATSHDPKSHHHQQITLRNTTAHTLSVTMGIRPFPAPIARDRSVAEWLFSYSRELGQTESGIQPPTGEAPLALNSLASSERFGLRALWIDGPPVNYQPGDFEFQVDISPGVERHIEYYAGPSSATDLVGSRIRRFVYWSMWSPLRFLALRLDAAIGYLVPKIGAFPFLVMIVLLIRLVTYPINRWSAQQQTAFTAMQAEFAPKIADIKSRLKGADQSEAILALYTSRGVSPFGGLKGSVGLFVQIPILVAMFNVAAESTNLQGVPYLWIEDVSQPERLLDWGIDIPLLGRFLNPIALLLVGFMLWAELRKPIVSTGQIAFAVALGALLYSFPAFLVIYWLLISIAQFAEGKLGGFAKPVKVDTLSS